MGQICNETESSSISEIFDSVIAPTAKIRQGAKTITPDTFRAAFHELQQTTRDVNISYDTTLGKDEERCIAFACEFSFIPKSDKEGRRIRDKVIAVIRFGEKGTSDEHRIVEWDELSVLSGV